MNLLKFNTIRNRLFFWFLTLTLGPLLVVLIIIYFQRVNVIQTRTFEKLSAIRDLKVERLNDWLIERQGDLEIFSTNTRITNLENLHNKINYDQNDIEIVNDARHFLKSGLLNYLVYQELFIINTKGKIIVSTNENNEGKDKSNNEYFTEPMSTRSLSLKDIYFSNELQKPSMAYSIPIFCSKHTGQHIIGILVLRINLHNSLYKMFNERVGLGKSGETLIVNKEGYALNELRWQNNDRLNFRISAEPASRAAKGETGIIESPDYRNEAILGAYTYIPKTGWGFVCKQDIHELNAPIREMMWNVILIFMVCAALIIIVIIRVSKSISNPIIAMSGVAKKIQEGDYSTRNTIFSYNELGGLALAFNNMADEIESKLIIQKGISDISTTIRQQSTMKEYCNNVLKKLMEITDANMTVFYVLDEVSVEYKHFASVGANKKLLKSFSTKNAEGEFGNVLADKRIYYLKDVPEDTNFKYNTSIGQLIPKEIITIPILVEGATLAIISIANINKFSPESIGILEQTWAVLNTTYSSLLSNERTFILAESLTRINQQLEVQSEELREQTEALHNQADELKLKSDKLHEQNITLEKQREEVEQANQLKTDFLSNMSHELRTPLNSINALSQVLLVQAGKKLKTEENEYLEIIARNGKRLLSLINDILDLSKIEAGKMELFLQPVSISSLLNVIRDTLLILAESKGIVVTLNVTNDIPMITTDEAKLYQILSNIASNAVKFTQKGSVKLSAWHQSENIFIKVEDTGIGISEDMLPKIFDEFRQVDGSSSREYQGTGLGLAIAKKLIETIGGEIEVESILNKGSAFTIKLPIQIEDKKFFNTNALTSIQPNISSEKMVLIIDDDLEVANNISEFLKNKNYNTIIATTGSDALEKAETYQPFAITLDIVMPEIDGWEVLQKLKSNARTKDIPVIIVSVLDDKETGFALGACGFLNKPVDTASLIKQINKLSKVPHLVMIVDDNKTDAEKLKGIVENEKIEAITAFSGNECLKLLKETRPDILIIDLIMPEMDGFELLAKLRTDPLIQNIPVIVVTAKDLTSADIKRLKGNVSSIISKGDDSHIALNSKIESILNELKNQKSEVQANDNNSKENILLVEDNHDNMTIFKAILQDDYTLVEAYDGEQGLKMAQDIIPDLIVLDMSLPVIDGEKVAEILKNDESTCNIPIIAVSARAMKGDGESFLAAGCDDFLSKPIYGDELKEKISNLLRIKNKNDHNRNA